MKECDHSTNSPLAKETKHTPLSDNPPAQPNRSTPAMQHLSALQSHDFAHHNLPSDAMAIPQDVKNNPNAGFDRASSRKV